MPSLCCPPNHHHRLLQGAPEDLVSMASPSKVCRKYAHCNHLLSFPPKNCICYPVTPSSFLAVYCVHFLTCSSSEVQIYHVSFSSGNVLPCVICYYFCLQQLPIFSPSFGCYIPTAWDPNISLFLLRQYGCPSGALGLELAP